GLNDIRPFLQHIRSHAETLQFHLGAHRVEKAHNHLFAVEHGKAGHTRAEFACAVLHIEASVLRFAPFVNMHPGGEFEAGQDVGNDVRVVLPDIVHHAVNAVADQKAAPLRLQVNIGRAEIKSLLHKKVYRTHGFGEFTAHLASDA